MKLRSMFSNIFGNSRQPPKQLRPLYSLNGGYDNYSMPTNITDDITVATCINCISSHFAKSLMQHTIVNGDYQSHKRDYLDSLLSQRPNEYNNSYDFLYKICYQLLSNNNAYVYIKRDKKANIIGLYPLDYNYVELMENNNNEVFCKFIFHSNEITVPYSNIIHLRHNYSNNAMYGGDSISYLQKTINDMAIAKQSLSKALKNSGKLRGYLQSEGTVRSDDLQKYVDNFVFNTVGNNSNGSGIGVLDNRFTYHQLTSDLKTADTNELNYYKQEIYNYFNINEKIINGTYTENEYNAFYESVVKPLVILTEQEFSSKIFTDYELQAGNRITIGTNRLEYGSIADKTKMAGVLMQTGICTINEFRQIFGFSPVDGGDERLVSLNYQSADSKGGEKTRK